MNLQERKETIAAFFVLECYSGLRNSDWSRFHVKKLNEGEAVKAAPNKNWEPVYLYLYSAPPLQRIVNFIRDIKLTYSVTLGETNRQLNIARACRIDKPISTHKAGHTSGSCQWNRACP